MNATDIIRGVERASTTGALTAAQWASAWGRLQSEIPKTDPNRARLLEALLVFKP